MPSVTERESRLVTYSKKPASHHSSKATRSRIQRDRHLVTLESPAKDAQLPSSPSLTLTSPSRSPVRTQKDSTVYHQNTGKRAIAKPIFQPRTKKQSCNVTVHASIRHTSPLRDASIYASPKSSSDEEPISDTESFEEAVQPKKRVRHGKDSRTLSNVRMSLKQPSALSKLKNASFASKYPTAILKAIERGTDGFEESEMFIAPHPKRKRIRNPRPSAVQPQLEILKGPMPPLQFKRDDSTEAGFVHVPAALANFLETDGKVLRSLALHKPPSRASSKASTIHVQPSSVSASARRQTSEATTNEESREEYENSFLVEQDRHHHNIRQELFPRSNVVS